MALVELNVVKEAANDYALQPMTDCEDCKNGKELCMRHHDEVWARLATGEAICKMTQKKMTPEWTRPADTEGDDEDPVWCYSPQAGTLPFEDTLGNSQKAARAFPHKEYMITPRVIQSPPKPPKS